MWPRRSAAIRGIDGMRAATARAVGNFDALSLVILWDRVEQAIHDRLDHAAWDRAAIAEAGERESLISILNTWPGISGQASKYRERQP